LFYSPRSTVERLILISLTETQIPSQYRIFDPVDLSDFFAGVRSSFQITDISYYFPEYEREIRGRLGSLA
jgi:hypothetical protein